MVCKMKLTIFLLALTTSTVCGIRLRRNLENKANAIKYISCEYKNHANCLTYDNTTQKCYEKDCWEYTTMDEHCAPVGKPLLPAIILQSIPVTGVFGSGFGNIGRWDIFGIYMAVVFGPLLLLCLGLCVSLCRTSELEEDGLTWSSLIVTGFSCLYSIAIVSLWIWGIVVIASKGVDAPYTNYKGEDIMCGLV